MRLPTYDNITELHRKYAPSQESFERVFGHCEAVKDVALQLMDRRKIDVDRELVIAGCLLHDIGVYPLFDELGHEHVGADYIMHGVRGEDILKKEGMPAELCEIASHHTGTGITKQQIESGHLPLPPRDYLARTPAEELVMYCDKFHSKHGAGCFNSFDWYADYVARFGLDRQKKFFELGDKFGKPDIEILAKKYNQPIRTVASRD